MLNRSFAKSVIALACVSLLSGAMIAFIAKPAAAELPAKSYSCVTSMSCGAGNYSCFVNCGDNGCACSIY